MKNTVNIIKQNWQYLLIPIIFISFLLINLNVVYLGDDYYYLTFRNLDFSEYFSKLIGHYQNDNGRFIVHLLATFFLKLPLPFWAILNSIFLTGICYFGAKVITTEKKNFSPLLCSILFFFLSALDISITRQSVYWLTGSFNYVYPLFLFFAYWFCLNKIENKKWFIASIFVGLLSSATMEQSAMMTFGLTVLMTLSHFKGFNKIKDFIQTNSKRLILCLITFIGLCTVILAPAQFKRIEIENAKEEISAQTGIVENVITLLAPYSISTSILPYCILFNILTIAYTIKNGIKKEKHIFPALAISNFFITLFNINYFVSPAIPSFIKYLLVGITLITYGVNFIYLNFKIYNSLINPLTITAILLIGSQGMMIVSPVLGPRNFIFGFVLFAFIIAILLDKISFKKLCIPTTCILLLIGLTLNINTANGYHQTKLIEEKNQEIIANSVDITKDKNKAITLYKFSNDNYAWSMPYISKYHEFYYKHFYQIKCQINWE